MVDYLVEGDGLTLAEAMARVHGDVKPPDRIKQQENRKLAWLLIEKVDSFFNACIQQHKLFSELENDMKAKGIEYCEPAYRYIRQAVRFYNRVTDEFIAVDFNKRVRLMQEHEKEYFFKLRVGDAIEL